MRVEWAAKLAAFSFFGAALVETFYFQSLLHSFAFAQEIIL
jgi:hypothetical protein